MLNLFEKLSLEIELAIFAAILSILLVASITLCITCKTKKPESNRPVRSNSWNFANQALPEATSINIESFTVSRSFSVYIRSESPRPEPRGFINPGYTNDDFINHLNYI